MVRVVSVAAAALEEIAREEMAAMVETHGMEEMGQMHLKVRALLEETRAMEAKEAKEAMVVMVASPVMAGMALVVARAETEGLAAAAAAAAWEAAAA